jgi:4-aminobutyrate aminotransferase-like enzyme
MLKPSITYQRTCLSSIVLELWSKEWVVISHCSSEANDLALQIARAVTGNEDVISLEG